MDAEDEKYAAQLLERMKQQNAAMMGGKGLPNRQPEVLGGGNIPDQAVLNSITQAPPPLPAQGAFDVCPQCGIMHPPLSQGQKCPVAKVEIKEAGLKEEDIIRFTVNMRDIAISQIEKKKIKEGNKLFKYLTIEFMKLLEGYKE